MAERKQRGGAGRGQGRKPKPKIELKADRSVATEVLAMDGPPDHRRKCECHECTGKKDCQCRKGEAGIVQCEQCKIRIEHKVCHCEICRWWQHRLSRDARIRYDADVYLTNRRDGKPAESIVAEGKLTIEVVERNGSADHPSTEADSLSSLV